MLASTQYSDPFIYNLGATDIAAAGGAVKSLRQLILALVGGKVPPVGVVAFNIIPLATLRQYGGYRPDPNPALQGFRPAAEGGGYITIPTTGQLQDLADPLDCVGFTADGGAPTGATIILYTTGQAGADRMLG